MDMPITYCNVVIDREHHIFIYFFMWEAYTEMLAEELDLRVMPLVAIKDYANSIVWKVHWDGQIQKSTDVDVIIMFIKCEYQRQFYENRVSFF